MNAMDKQNNFCTQFQMDVLEINTKEHLSKEQKKHLSSCPECQEFFEMHLKCNDQLQTASLQIGLNTIRNNLLSEIQEDKPQSNFADFIQFFFSQRFRAAIAISVSVLLIAVLWTPYVNHSNVQPKKDFVLFEQQDSLFMYNLKLIQNQNLGTSSKDDTLISRLLHVFPDFN